MAEERPKLGLILHSNLARRYAASEDRVGQAADMMLENYSAAAAMQAAHYGAVLNHLDERGIY